MLEFAIPVMWHSKSKVYAVINRAVKIARSILSQLAGDMVMQNGKLISKESEDLIVLTNL